MMCVESCIGEVKMVEVRDRSSRRECHKGLPEALLASSLTGKGRGSRRKRRRGEWLDHSE